MKHGFDFQDVRSTVLVVDDQPASLRQLCEALADHFDLLVARSGEEALALCQNLPPPDLVLMDMTMPGMGGLRCCELLSSEPATENIPVIFVTASHLLEDELACWTAGAADFITKPATPLTVQKRVDSHLRIKRMADQLRRDSLTDYVTGLPNRRAFEHAFKLAWDQGVASGGAVTLMLADVDRFKAFNDTYGHGAGDEALRVVACELWSCTRGAGDLVARVGGEEFAILLPGADEAAANAYARRALDAFRALSHPHSGSEFGYLTISLGAVCSTPGPGRGLGWYMRQADKQLYAAKEGGRATSRCETVDAGSA